MMKKFLAMFVAVALAAVAYGVTVTNQGQVITVSTLDEAMDASTVYGVDQSTYATPVHRQGVIVASWRMPAGDDTGAVGDNKFGPSIPKGAILNADGAIVEVGVAITPTTASNQLAISSISIGTNDILNAAGVQDLAITTGITTNSDQINLLIAGSAATQGQFTVYLPYILGNAE